MLRGIVGSGAVGKWDAGRLLPDHDGTSSVANLRADCARYTRLMASQLNYLVTCHCWRKNGSEGAASLSG